MRLRLQLKPVFTYVLMMSFIMVSGTPIGYVYSICFDPLFLLFSILYFCLYGEKKLYINKRLGLLLFFIAIYLISFLMYFDDAVNIRAYISLLMRVVSSYIFCCSMDVKIFEHIFHKLVYVIAIYSLICYIIGQTSSVLNLITMYENKYPMFFLYNYTGYKIHRNSGIFWEPGAYQFFLNLALFFHISEQGYSLKKIFDFENIILILSVFSTLSTSGYITFICMILYVIYRCWRELSTWHKIVFVLPALVVMIVATVVIGTSSTVIDKFSETNGSYNIRRNDFEQSIEAVTERPWMGYGVESGTYLYMANVRSIIANSVGFFCAALSFGLPYAIMYSIFLFGYCWKFHKSESVPMIALLAISCVTEDFYRYAIYLVLVFGFSKKTSNKKLTKRVAK